LSRVHIPTKEELEALEIQQRENAAHMQMQFEHNDVDNLDSNMNNTADQAPAQPRNFGGGVAAAGVSGVIAGNGNTANNEPNPYAGSNISRNAPCPCGSGLKYKQCHGKI